MRGGGRRSRPSARRVSRRGARRAVGGLQPRNRWKSQPNNMTNPRCWPREAAAPAQKKPSRQPNSPQNAASAAPKKIKNTRERTRQCCVRLGFKWTGRPGGGVANGLTMRGASLMASRRPTASARGRGWRRRSKRRSQSQPAAGRRERRGQNEAASGGGRGGGGGGRRAARRGDGMGWGGGGEGSS